MSKNETKNDITEIEPVTDEAASGASGGGDTTVYVCLSCDKHFSPREFRLNSMTYGNLCPHCGGEIKSFC
ncbi:MAG: hypothetical protein PHI27_11180 [Eubacteriales bacterium]|nr:hypothetical protein [Eubacteriales bacterium]MDD3882793.1 hypothetical protein [Eubacteriales bacterium]MDD4512937.1 hypothetical protein [Eubacteriales bacterium]